MSDQVSGPVPGRVCRTCRYWRTGGRGDTGRPDGDTGWGQCRRMPPALPLVRDDKLLLVGVWPHTEEGDWCGEWQADEAT